MVRTCQLIEISLKMRNRFLRHLRGGRSKGGVSKPQTLRGVYISLVQKCMPLLSRISPKGKGLGIVRFNFPPMMKRYIDSGQSRNLNHILTLLTP